MRRSGTCLALAALALLCCARNPVSGRPEIVLMSLAQEREAGRRQAAQLERTLGRVSDSTLGHWVAEVGRRLARHSPRRDVPYAFGVLDSRDPNAFALPGGHVYVSRGLLAFVNEEDELAGVLAHEIGHVAARHQVQRLTVAAPFAIVLGVPARLVGTFSETLGSIVALPGSLAGGLVLARHDRAQEREADRIGMQLAAKAGWNPAALAGLLRRLEQDDALDRERPRRHRFFESHPSSPERVAEIVERAASYARAEAEPIAGSRAAVFRRLEGLLIGANPAHGVFEGTRLVHPDLGFTVDFPRGWETRANPDAAWASDPERDGVVSVVQVAARGDDPRRGALADGLRDDLADGLEPLSIHGLAAVRLEHEEAGAFLDLTWIAHRGRVLRVASTCPRRARAEYASTLRRVAKSFAPLGAEERAAVRVNRLRVRAASGGETFAAWLSGLGTVWSPDRTAVANDRTVDAELRVGELVKLVVAEPYAPE